MSKGPYRSTGTIRVQLFKPSASTSDSTCCCKKCCRSLLQWTTKIFFTPNADSTVRYVGKDYAVFIGKDGDDCCKKSELKDAGKGIQIDVTGDCPGLVAAATQRTLVEVEVKKCKEVTNCKSDLVLHAITIPATGNKK